MLYRGVINITITISKGYVYIEENQSHMTSQWKHIENAEFIH